MVVCGRFVVGDVEEGIFGGGMGTVEWGKAPLE